MYEEWIRLHGDNKSKSEGSYRIVTMKDSKGNYKAKIKGSPNQSSVIIAKAGDAQPSFQDVVDKLKAAFP